MLGGDWTDGTMTDFKWRHFQGDVILWAVRWYCRYPISYRDLEEMLAERGISVDHTTIYRWVQCYAPEMEKRLRWFWRRGFDPSWRLDETYVKEFGSAHFRTPVTNAQLFSRLLLAQKINIHQ